MTIFIVIMQMGVSAAIIQVVFSVVHYAHDCFYCNYSGESFFYSYVGRISSNNFIFLSLTDSLFS